MQGQARADFTKDELDYRCTVILVVMSLAAVLVGYIAFALHAHDVVVGALSSAVTTTILLYAFLLR